jgi:hypothetical protein
LDGKTDSSERKRVGVPERDVENTHGAALFRFNVYSMLAALIKKGTRRLPIFLIY